MSSSIVESPIHFASQWYKAEDIHRAILRNTDGGFGERVPVPEDVYSLDFAVFLAEQYRLAMIKGATLAIEEMKSSYRKAFEDLTVSIGEDGEDEDE